MLCRNEICKIHANPLGFARGEQVDFPPQLFYVIIMLVRERSADTTRSLSRKSGSSQSAGTAKDEGGSCDFTARRKGFLRTSAVPRREIKKSRQANNFAEHERIAANVCDQGQSRNYLIRD